MKERMMRAPDPCHWCGGSSFRVSGSLRQYLECIGCGGCSPPSPYEDNDTSIQSVSLDRIIETHNQRPDVQAIL